MAGANPSAFEVVARYSYNGPWRLARKNLGGGSYGASLVCLYDEKRRERSHHWRDASLNTLVGFRYKYDDVDNPLYEQFIHDGGKFDNYRYNARYELTGVRYRDAGQKDYRTYAGAWTNDYGYDDNFNRNHHRRQPKPLRRPERDGVLLDQPRKRVHFD